MDVRKRDVLKPMRWLVVALCLIGCSGKGPSIPYAPRVVKAKQKVAAQRASHEKMVAELKALRFRVPYFNGNQLLEMRRSLRGTNDVTLKGWQMRRVLGTGELIMGKERESIREYARAMAIGKKLQSEMPEGAGERTLFSLAVAYFRRAERENGLKNYRAQSGILPIDSSAIQQDTAAALEAIRSLEFVLKLDAANMGSVRYNRALWLLNIAYMQIGQYPDEVPENWRLDPSIFLSEVDFPGFPNIARQAGFTRCTNLGGVIAEDFDRDGDLDLLLSDWRPTEPLAFYENQADEKRHGKFTERSEQAGLAGLFGGANLVQADYDNDGYADVYVLRGAWMGEDGKQPNSLLHNNGDGTFTDVTHMAGLAEVSLPSQTAAWGDYDLDGDLDLYVGNEPLAEYRDKLFGREAQRAASVNRLMSPSQLFRNNGDGTFTDVAESSGVTNLRQAKGVVWGDYDNDRWPDLYVSNYRGENRLYHNNQDGTFRDVAPEQNVTGPEMSFPVWFWDVDNDGTLDLYVSAYSARTNDLVDHFQNQVPKVELAKLYRGTENGFEDATQSWYLKRPTSTMGGDFGDLNNDGYLDFYLGQGDASFQQLIPNLVYLNNQGKAFTDVSISGRFSQIQKGHAAAFGDFDQDGDQDIFARTGGSYPGDGYFDTLHENPGFGNHWITMQLTGVTSNRSAIGTRIRLDITENGVQRSIHRRVNSGGSGGSHSLMQTIGLGAADSIDRMEIYWPASDLTQVFENVRADQRLLIVEGDAKTTRLPDASARR